MFNNKSAGLFATCIIAWSTVFFEKFKRTSTKYAVDWGTHAHRLEVGSAAFANDQLRPNFLASKRPPGTAQVIPVGVRNAWSAPSLLRPRPPRWDILAQMAFFFFSFSRSLPVVWCLVCCCLVVCLFGCLVVWLFSCLVV
jgi:hypothetical protein